MEERSAQCKILYHIFNKLVGQKDVVTKKKHNISYSFVYTDNDDKADHVSLLYT